MPYGWSAGSRYICPQGDFVLPHAVVDGDHSEAGAFLLNKNRMKAYVPNILACPWCDLSCLCGNECAGLRPEGVGLSNFVVVVLWEVCVGKDMFPDLEQLHTVLSPVPLVSDLTSDLESPRCAL